MQSSTVLIRAIIVTALPCNEALRLRCHEGGLSASTGSSEKASATACSAEYLASKPFPGLIFSDDEVVPDACRSFPAPAPPQSVRCDYCGIKISLVRKPARSACLEAHISKTGWRKPHLNRQWS